MERPRARARGGVLTEVVASAEWVRRLLGGAEYTRLFAAARARIEAGGEAARAVTLADLGDGERRALASLAGWDTVPAGPVRVDLSRLDQALKDSAAGASLREVLHVLGGPLRNRRAERRGRREALERMWSAAREAVDGEDRPDLRRWIDALRASGGLARAAQASRRDPADLLEAALRVALRLPARGELLAVFAARTAGDPHALDAGTPLGGLVLRAAAAITGLREGPTSSSGRRRLWREVGIDCDSLSADVLVLGLRPDGDGLLVRHLRESADAGDPRRLTLREIARAPLAVQAGTVVHVCENPAVVEAAANALGPRCAPLVCVEGVPSTAALTLLKALTAAGARLRVHADLDWGGLRIAAQVLAEAGGSPWHMAAADYRAAVETAGHGPPLGGRRAQADWDPDLALAMLEGGRAVMEEQMLDVLLGDLEQPKAP